MKCPRIGMGGDHRICCKTHVLQLDEAPHGSLLWEREISKALGTTTNPLGLINQIGASKYREYGPYLEVGKDSPHTDLYISLQMRSSASVLSTRPCSWYPNSSVHHSPGGIV